MKPSPVDLTSCPLICGGLPTDNLIVHLEHRPGATVALPNHGRRGAGDVGEHYAGGCLYRIWLKAVGRDAIILRFQRPDIDSTELLILSVTETPLWPSAFTIAPPSLPAFTSWATSSSGLRRNLATGSTRERFPRSIPLTPLLLRNEIISPALSVYRAGLMAVVEKSLFKLWSAPM